MELSKGNAEIQVGIADYKVTASPYRLITLGLGSCVGVALYDSIAKVGGLLHIMLPDSKQFNNVSKPAKFADTGIPLMISEIKRKGGNASRLTAKLVGGAQMFSGLDEKFVLNIGQRNAVMTKNILSQLGIRVLAEELGGNRGRTMIFDTTTGQVTIRTIGTPLKVI
ncbi:chemotaxis protein CheD [Desulfotomaculum sp. 1211_IL3151]|uniref:chemotaxis protein CheD n=1 Tax=Desulfotomaculum sp. 1211_IL3151 TaxID=3084055 RepID=UPI002FD94675